MVCSTIKEKKKKQLWSSACKLRNVTCMSLSKLKDLKVVKLAMAAEILLIPIAEVYFYFAWVVFTLCLCLCVSVVLRLLLLASIQEWE